MVELVLGIIGEIGAGKDTVARHLTKKYHFKKHVMSDILRAEARVFKLKPTRSNLERISEKLMKKYGHLYLIQKTCKKITKENPKRAVIDGLRLAFDIEFCKERFGKKFKLAYVTASQRTRFKRMKARGRTGDPKTFAEFQRQDAREFRDFRLKETFRLAHHKISTEGSRPQTFRRVDVLMKKIL